MKTALMVMLKCVVAVWVMVTSAYVSQLVIAERGEAAANFYLALGLGLPILVLVSIFPDVQVMMRRKTGEVKEEE